MDTPTDTLIPPRVIDELLEAPARRLDDFARTARNGIRAARRDGVTRYIGFTGLAYYIETRRPAQGVRFIAYGDGTVSKAGR